MLRSYSNIPSLQMADCMVQYKWYSLMDPSDWIYELSIHSIAKQTYPLTISLIPMIYLLHTSNCNDPMWISYLRWILMNAHSSLNTDYLLLNLCIINSFLLITFYVVLFLITQILNAYWMIFTLCTIIRNLK